MKIIPFLVLLFVVTGHWSVFGQEVKDRKHLIGELIPITGNDERSVDLYIYFKLGKAEVSQAATQQLAELTAALNSPSLAPHMVRIVGHTDATGSAESNQLLSEARAGAVRAYLVKNNVAPKRLQSIGKGEAELLSEYPANNALQRRVEIIVIRGADHVPEAANEKGYVPLN